MRIKWYGFANYNLYLSLPGVFIAGMSYVPVKLLFQQRHHIAYPEACQKIEIAGIMALSGKDFIERRFKGL